MALNEETKTSIRELFEEVLNVLDAMDNDGNGDDALDGDSEALRFVEWVKTKASLRYGSISEEGEFQEASDETEFPIIYGGIYWAYLGRNIGDEMNKHRPVIVTRADRKSGVCTVIPLTKERLGDAYWYHIDLDELDNTAIVEQMRVISKRRIEKPMRIEGKIATATEKDMAEIYKQIHSHFSKPRPPRK